MPRLREHIHRLNVTRLIALVDEAGGVARQGGRIARDVGDAGRVERDEGIQRLRRHARAWRIDDGQMNRPPYLRQRGFDWPRDDTRIVQVSSIGAPVVEIRRCSECAKRTHGCGIYALLGKIRDQMRRFDG